MMYGWSGGMWVIGPLMMVAIIWLVVWLVRDTARPTNQASNWKGATGILEERFARGEIDRDEYLQRRAALEGGQK